MSKGGHRQAKVKPEEKVLPHLQEARPDFVAELKALRQDTVPAADIDRITQSLSAGEVLNLAKQHATALGWTPGDISLVSDALLSSSEDLKKTGISLGSGNFRARLVRRMEAKIGQSLAQTKQNQGSTIYLGEFKPADEWILHHNKIFYGTVGPRLHEHFTTTVAHCPRTGFALANSFHKHLQSIGVVPEKLVVHEYGIGNGNLSAAFLQRMLELDQTRGTDYLRRINLVLCDFSDQILQDAKSNPFLMQFSRNVLFAKVDAETLKPEDLSLEPYFKEGCVHKMFSNELADTLRAHVCMKDNDKLTLSLLKPFIKRDALARLGIRDVNALQQAYAAGDLDALRRLPQFLEHVDFEITGRNPEPGDIPDMDLALEFMRELPHERNFSVNYGLQNHLKAAMRLLDREKGQGYDLFDTGEIQPPAEMLSQIIQAKGDYCFSVNFKLAKSLCERAGFKVPVLEHQTDFVSRELQPVVLLEEVLETHRSSGTLEQNIALLRKTAPVMRPNYRNVIDQWEFIRGTKERARQLCIQVSEHELAGLYDQQCEQGRWGIKHHIIYLTKPEVEESLPSLQQLGFERTRVLNLFEHHRHKPKDFVHMRINP